MARNYITGIDVGTNYVKVIIASAKEKSEKGFPKILGAGIAESRGLRHGYVVSAKDVTDSIRHAITIAEEKSGIKVKKAFLGIGGVGLSSTIVTSTLITSRADAEITDLELDKLREQCEKDIPHASIANKRIIYNIPLQYKLDGVPSFGTPLGQTANKIELKSLFITCFDHHVDDLIQAVNDCGVEVEDIMASPVSGGFVTLSKSQKVAGCVLANIGAETTSIAVFENNIPTSLEVFPIGSTDITNDIALGLKVPLEEAEQIKIGAITGSTYPRKKLEEIILARLDDIFDLINEHLRKIGRNGLLPAGVVIIGGGSGLSSIDEVAKSSLKLPARIGSLGLSSNSASAKDSTWAVAYGLCVWGLHTEEGPELDASMQFIKHTLRTVARWFKQFLP